MRKMVLTVVVVMGMMLIVSAGFAQTNLTVVRHSDNTIWKMTCEGTSNCSAWTPVTGGFSVQPTLTWDPALNKYILIGIGNNGSTIWRSTFNADGTWNSNWVPIGSGAMGSPSPVAVTGGMFKGYTGRVAIVAPSGGNYADPEAAMLDLSTWCPSPSESNACLLKIMPGTYDLGTAHIDMASYVDIEGSGVETTIIKGHGPSVVIGASHAELRFLRVQNTGQQGVDYASAIYNSGASPRIMQVVASAEGSTSIGNFAVWNVSGSSPLLFRVKAYAANGTAVNRGIYNVGNSNPSLTHVDAEATVGNFADGIRNEDSSPVLDNVTVLAQYGGINTYAFSSDGASSPTILKSQLSAGSPYGSHAAIYNGSGVATTVAHTQLAPSMGLVNLGTLICVGAYNGGFAPLDNHCQ